MHIETEAIICGLTTHGEHGGVVRLLTPEQGMVAAYVRGARGRRMRPVLIPGNVVAAQLRWKTEGQLPQGTIELSHSRAPMLSEPLPAAAIEWATAIVAAALPERQPYPRIYQALAGLLDAVEAAPSASGWAAALASFELLVLGELGYGKSQPLGKPDSAEVLAALDRSGKDLFRQVLTGRFESLADCRARLIDRLRRRAS